MRIPRTRLASTREAFKQGFGRRNGCDWDIEYGTTRLPLRGLRANEADDRSLAQAAKWLREVEADAAAANLAALHALVQVELLVVGRPADLDKACRWATEATELQDKYSVPDGWRSFRDALLALASGRPAVEA